MNYNHIWISAKEAINKMTTNSGLDGIRFTISADWDFPQYHMFDGRINESYPEDWFESYTPEEFLDEHKDDTFREVH